MLPDIRPRSLQIIFARAFLSSIDQSSRSSSVALDQGVNAVLF
jgi:hypothetical protein